jgi:Putative bacterial sensory transduction regulator
MTAVAAASALLTAAAAAQPAQPPLPPWNPAAPENRQVLPSFNYGSVEAVLTQIGAHFQRQGTADRPVLTVTFANGRRAAILFGICDAGGAACKAISIQAVWNRPPDLTAERMGGALHAFNQRYAFARAFVTADGRPTLQRYLTADYGFIRGNLAVNLVVFASQVDRFVNEVLRAPAPAAPVVVRPPAPAAPPPPQPGRRIP